MKMNNYKEIYEKGIGVVSASKLTTYWGCPLAYFFKYIEHLEVPKKAQIVFGEVIHYILDQFYKKKFKSKKSFLNWAWFYWNGIVEGKFGQKTEIAWSNPIRQKLMFRKYRIEITDAQAQYFAKTGLKIMESNKLESIIGYKTPQKFFSAETQHNQFKKYDINITFDQALAFSNAGLRLELEPYLYGLLAMKILSQFYDKNFASKENVLYHEKQTRQDFEGFKILGKFDRIEKTEQGIEIIDYKTSKESPENSPEIEFVLHHSVQFTSYSKVFRLWQGIKEARLQLYHLRSGKLFETKRSEKDYDYLHQLIRTTNKRIIEGDFTPFYGFHCKICDYIIPCNERRIGVGEGISAFIERIEKMELKEPENIKIVDSLWAED